MSKYTPGPWKAFPSGIYGTNRDGVCVCTRHKQAGDEWNANARLIAAAPDLLEALVDVEEWLAAYVSGVGAEWDEMRANIRAAITKATKE